MMKSLRSLCLLKVSSEGFDYADLHPTLVKDLNLMKAFNGNFNYELEEYGAYDRENHSITFLTILFDGVFWTFSSFYFEFDMENLYEMGLKEFQVIEGQPVSATSPFRYIRHRLETGYRKQMMKMTVNVSQEGTYGIKFVINGFNGDCYFVSDMQMYFTMTGTRVLFHDWCLHSRTQTSIGYRYQYDGLPLPEHPDDIKLIESQVSAAAEYERYQFGSEESVSDCDRNDILDWGNAEVEMTSTEPLPSPISLPYYENTPGIVTHVSSDRKSVWFCPASFQSALDSLMDKLDKWSTNLNPLPISHVLPGQLCVAKYCQDNGLYRAKVTEVGDMTVEVFYIDYGDKEIKKIDELYMLPKELQSIPAAAINVETEFIHVTMEARMVVEEVVIRLEGWEGKGSSRFFIRGEEIGVTPV